MNLSNLLFTEQKRVIESRHISIKNKPIEGNVIISQLLKSNKIFSIVRCGIGAETVFSYCFLEKMDNYEERYKEILKKLHNNAGIYFDENRNGSDKILYANLFNLALETSTYLANWNNSWISSFESKFINVYKLDHFDACGLDFFSYSTPWTKFLKGKRVLIIHPFTKSISSQYKKRELLFLNKDMLPEFELMVLKSPNTSAGNKLGKSWVDNYTELCSEIDKVDFDVALLGCGGYGLPLVNYIRNYKNKSAIYVGGILQLLFGIKGKRWDDQPEVQKLYNEHWIRPDEKERVDGFLNVEDGCYW
jgi:hypothetical protein